MKLEANQMALLRLVAKGADEFGWAKVNKKWIPFFEAMPRELVVLVESDEGWKAQLTRDGAVVLKWA